MKQQQGSFQLSIIPNRICSYILKHNVCHRLLPLRGGWGGGNCNFEIFFKNQDTQKHYSKFDLLLEFIENSKLQDPFELLN